MATVLIISVGVAAGLIWLIVQLGSREMVPVPGPDQPGYLPNGGADVFPTQFSLGSPPLPDIEVAEHVSPSTQAPAPGPQHPREP